MIFQNRFSTRLTSSTLIAVVLMAGVVLPKSVSGDQNQNAKKAAEGVPKVSVTQDDMFQDLIQEVKRNENLYADLKLRLTSVYERLPKPADVNKQIQTETDIVIDLQGEKFHQKSKSKKRFYVTSLVPSKNHPSYLSSGTSESIDVFDGISYRNYRAHDYIPDKKDKPRNTVSFGTISDKTPSVSNLARPHMFLRGSGKPHVPLSTYLEGSRAITAYPGSDADMRNMYFEKQILDAEEFQGLQCIKVQMEWIGSKGKPYSRDEIWLTKERNFIPVRRLYYKYRWSKEIPVAEYTVDAWKELRPGIWFPMQARRNQYNSLSKKPTDKREIWWRILYDVKSITLDPPQRAPDVFTKLDFPKGTIVDVFKGRGR